jgi:hypothetical protein
MLGKIQDIIVKWLEGPSWSWSYGSWIYKYLCNQCLSPLMLWVRMSIRARCTTLCDKVCQWLVTCRWFSPDSTVSSTNKTDYHDITEILWKVVLNTINQTNKHTMKWQDVHFFLYLDHSKQDFNISFWNKTLSFEDENYK